MKTMSEMRRYHKPPRKVHEVMQAVMLLFKQDEETTTVIASSNNQPQIPQNC